MTNDKKNEDVSFEELLKENMDETGWLEPGERMEVKIVDIGSDWVFLGLGGKSEGLLDKKELLDENGEFPYKVGDSITVYFLSSRHGEYLFTTRITSGEAGRNFLEHAWASKIPVEGLVEKEIKGGYQVRIAGDTRAFCPFSQMGLRRTENASEYIGNRLSFLITEYGEKGRNVILSNRAILEEEEREKREALKKELHAGMQVSGTVASIQKFGAFIDIGGIQGLLPISEIGWERVDDVASVLSVGQKLELMIMNLDWEKDRVSFSLKAMLPDPWDHVERNYPEGSSHVGTVARLTKFGAFVTLEGGVDGLIHISKLGGGKRINHPNEVLELGQSVAVTVEAVDLEKKRLSLKLEHEEKGTDETGMAEEEDYRAYLQKTPTSMGTLGDLLKDKLALAVKNKKMKK
ncbi:MAG TPA: 30S ribosomal protein S1 [Syntrophales bacterium]|nr:30S ribosomal protein S1 [Syntrophales bacterium]HPQ44989.1 30S ribosomal protein S1 [Syntrophales bacterium]